MTLPKYLRQYIYKGFAFEIIQLRTTNYISSLVSGYIGIAPYTNIENDDPFSLVQPPENLLYQMRGQNVIDN